MCTNLELLCSQCLGLLLHRLLLNNQLVWMVLGRGIVHARLHKELKLLCVLDHSTAVLSKGKERKRKELKQS